MYQLSADVAIDQNGAEVNAKTRSPTPIEIGKPHASNYGPIYWHRPDQGSPPWDFTDDVAFSISELGSLGDGTGYGQLGPTESTVSSAGETINRLITQDAVFHFVGQTLLMPDGTSPAALLFYSDPSPEGDPDNTLVSAIAARSTTYPPRTDIQGGLYYLDV